MKKPLKLYFSPCPNDTFIFDALVNGKIDTEGMEFDYRMEDVETLNNLALQGSADMIKVSYHAYIYLLRNYVLLESGSALGSGNGPLLIAKKEIGRDEINGMTIALPGMFTTAHLLFRVAFPDANLKRFMIFSKIEEAILDGSVDAGVIIHENRFTYEKKGLVKILDLGEYWESMTNGPIPLGGIVAKKSLGYETIARLNRILYRSVSHAMENPEGTMGFVRCNAMEMELDVIMKHIFLYVNEYTLSLGDTGKRAIQQLIERTASFRSNP